MGWAHLVFVDDPTARLFVLALVEPFVFDDLVHGDVLESCGARQLLCVRCFAYAGCAGDDDVGVLTRHGVVACSTKCTVCEAVCPVGV